MKENKTEPMDSATKIALTVVIVVFISLIIFYLS